MAAYLYNGPEYLETYVAAFKGGFAPVNTNYRYGPEEIVYLFDNADAEAVVFHAAFAELLDGVRGRLPKVRRWYCVADGTAPVPDWARRLRDGGRAAGADRVEAPWGRSRRRPAAPLHRRHHRHAQGRDVAPGRPVQRARRAAATPCSASRRPRRSRSWRRGIDPATPGLVMLPACPLMHGTGQFSSLIAMNLGGADRHAAVAQASTPPSCGGEVEPAPRPTRSSSSARPSPRPMLDVLDDQPGRATTCPASSSSARRA